MKELMKTNVCAAKYSGTVTYTDDLLILNNAKFEEQLIDEIYPSELCRKKTSETSHCEHMQSTCTH